MSDAGCDGGDAGHDPADRWEGLKRHAPATQRNREPIAECLAKLLPETGTVLEIASGSGEHALFLARRFPALRWQPSDPDADALKSIAAWKASEGADLANLANPVALDAAAGEWPVIRADAILCVNMVHISPWAATEGLFAGAARLLPAGGMLAIYGPFLADDIAIAPSNAEFDRSLRQRNPAWGIRDLADIDTLARSHGMDRVERILLPANNMLLAYRRG